MSTHAVVEQLLREKITHHDKDERYMAINDICTYLDRESNVSADLERKICDAVLLRLDDESNDVQSVAVRCLGKLVKKVQPSQIQLIAQKLVSLLRKPTSKMRDIYSIGLKSLIDAVGENMHACITTDLIANKDGIINPSGIIGGISQNDSNEIKRECLDVLDPILKKFGTKFPRNHGDIMSAVLNQLDAPDQGIRKRAATAIGSLASVIDDSLLNVLIGEILGRINRVGSKISSPQTLTLVQATHSISDKVGFRLGGHVARLIPELIKFCGDPDNEDQQTEVFDTMREQCLPGLELFVKHCLKEVTQEHIASIVNLAVRLMKYDPNCVDPIQDLDELNMDTGDVEEEESEEDYDDDDGDNSWKVRKAASKVLAAVFKYRLDDIERLINISAKDLCMQLQDREENVRIQVIATIMEMIQSCQKFLKRNPSNVTIVANLNQRLIGIIKVCNATFTKHEGKKKYEKTKQKLFELLGALVKFHKDGIGNHLPVLITFSEKILSMPLNGSKEDALLFVRIVLDNISTSVLSPSLGKIFDLLVRASSDARPKVLVENLRCLISFIRTLTNLSWIPSVARPLSPSGSASDSADVANLRVLIQTSFTRIILPRLQARADGHVDLEVIEAIEAASQLYYSFGDLLIPSLPDTIRFLCGRLENEASRAPALNSLISIMRSPLQLSIKELFPHGVNTITSFILLTNRPTKQFSMELIEELIKRNHEGLTTEMVSNIIVNATNQMSDNDLVLAQMSIRIITALIKLHSSPSNLDLSQRVVYDKVLNFASSQKDLGATLDVITQLLAVMCEIKGTTLTCSQIIQDIFTKKLTLKDVSSSKQSILNLALCAASLVRESPSSATIISKLATTISSASSGLPDKLFSLSTLGEVGRVIDFSQDTANTNIILDCFQNPSEDIKYFAAISFGKLCVGNMDHFISIIMKYIRTNHQVHLILISLKEAINIHVIQKKSFEPYFDSRHGNLDQCFRALVVVDDESIRNVVTECMGLLLRIHEHQVLPWFISLAQGSKIEKWTALTGLKHAMSNREFKSPTIFGHLIHFFELLDDPDVDVRKSALLLLNTAYFYHPNLSENFHLYASIAPKVIRELEFEKIITLDLGAVKHTEDVGRPIRKAALTCLETILSCSGEGLDIVPFIDPLKKLLKDKEKEIRPQACQVIIKMCTIHPLFMSSLTSQLIEPLESMLSAAAADQKKVSRGDPDYDRCKEVFRVCFETIDAISKIDAVTHNPLWMEFSERIKKNPDYNKGE